MSFLLGERFCKVISNNSNVVTNDELVSAVNIIYKGDIIERIKFVFKMYDLNNNKQVTPAEVRLLISHIPVVNRHNQDDTNFEFFNQSQADINSLIAYCFTEQKTMDFTEFIKVTNEKSSDMFFVVY
jgi:Ca2+-binding EF-hand superfamily protein